jgi:hypothetical protein
MFKIRKIENTITHGLNPTFLKFSFVVKIGVKTFQNIQVEFDFSYKTTRNCLHYSFIGFSR